MSVSMIIFWAIIGAIVFGGLLYGIVTKNYKDMIHSFLILAIIGVFYWRMAVDNYWTLLALIPIGVLYHLLHKDD